MPRYDYVLFDADNTLYDFDRAEDRALALTLEHYGFPDTPEIRARYSAGNRALWAAFDRREVTKDFLLVERFAAFQRQMGTDHDSAEMNLYYLTRLSEGAFLLPGAEELCRALAPHCTLAIITNGVTLAQTGRFSRSPLRDVIPHLFISEQLGTQKPDPAFFDAVLSALAVPDRSRAVVVGDSLTADIQGAVNSGLDSVWYNPKGLPIPDTPRPTLTACSYQQVLEYILGD